MTATPRRLSTFAPAFKRISLALLLLSTLLIFAYPSVGKPLWQLFQLSASVYLFANLQKKPLFAPGLLFLAALVVQGISWYASIIQHPEYAETSLKVQRLGNWFSFILVAWVLKDTPKWIWFTWILGLIGLLLVPWTQGNGWAEFQNSAIFARSSFGFTNAEHAGMLYGAGLIGLLVLSGRWFRRSFTSKKPLALARITVCIALIVYCATLVLLAETRAIFVGLLAAFIVIGILLVSQLRRFSWQKLLASAAAVCIVLVALIASTSNYSQLLPKRWQQEIPTITAALNGNYAAIANDSAGIRLKSWLAASEWIQQRPLTGWGGSGRGLVMQHLDSLPLEIKKQFRHLHNSYLDTLVNYGSLGGVLLLLLHGYFAVASWKAWRLGKAPGDVSLFSCAFLAYWLVVNFFESYLFYTSGTTLLALTAGGIIAFYWQQITNPQIA
ncbi:Hypothetical protein HDN1F_27730 [gamma proteobacterium HdN1]|nr:Hypothetical protein HDN1F_27730 [gamma proteobacterium HdN1]